MANIITTVKSDITNELAKRGEDTRKVAEAMLIAGAEALKKNWEEVITEESLIDSGDMKAAVGYNPAKALKGGELEIDVYPFGKDYKGTSNATKAAMLHYGTSTFPMTRFIDEIEKRTEKDAEEAMRKVMEEWISTGRVPEVTRTPFNKRGTKSKRKKRKEG